VTLDKLIADHIRTHGPITVGDYMVQALAHPELGYYIRKDPFGIQGDFITAPETSQVFGEIIGAWLVTQWVMMGKPKAALAEIGPGRGTLMADILRATSKVKGFHESISVHLMEISPVLRQKQWNSLAGKHPDIQWHLGFGEIPDKPLLLVANEFFDALPIRQLLHLENGWMERKVALDKRGALHFIIEPATPPEVLAHEPVSDDYYEYSDAASLMATAIGDRILTYGGSALIIDYGYEEGHGDTLQAMKNHQYHDVLTDPGSADITAHVDFNNLIHAAVAGGANAYGTVSQASFLLSLGAKERTDMLCLKAMAKQKKLLTTGLDRLTSPSHMGELFKVLCLVDPTLPKPEGF
jgi:NADH dehydrogenase [ubiquinone] 1 alpha subcomplex assembly factor 7